jgi:hypothetical protein
VTGTGFVAGSTLMWGTTAITPTSVTATSLTATIPAADYATAATPSVTVVLPDGATTNASTFTVN